MDLGFYSLIGVGFMAIAGELVDSSLGMMYGTLLSPILVLIGYDPKLVVPAILISQAIGGGIGTLRHHNYRNANFNGLTRDMKIALAIIVPGTLAAVLGAYIGQVIPKDPMKIYIGALVTVMGLLCIFPIYFKFSWKRIWGIGVLSGFNKALSGGGFGPVTSTGKILGGVDPKVSVGTTTLAEVPICLVSFGMWILFGGYISWQFPLALCLGAFVGGLLGPYITTKFNTKVLKLVVGVLAVVSGIWVILALFLGVKGGGA